MSSQPSGSTVTIRDSGKASAIPAESPPPPQGTSTIVAARAPSCSRDLDADAALPFDDVDIVERGHQGRAPLRGEPGADLLAALGGAVVGDDLGAGREGRVALHRGRVGRHDDGRRDAEPPGRDRHALGVVARGEGDHAARSAPPRSAASSRLVAPRSLKLPPCCRHSAFTQSRTPSHSSGSSGVLRHVAGDALRRSGDTLWRWPSLCHPSLW